MATDGPDPAPCNQEIFEKGEPIALLSGSSNAVEKWVKEVAKKANAIIDWHYSGGVAQVLHLGDSESRRRTEEVIMNMSKVDNPRVMRCLHADSPGLFREGVTKAPEGAVATFIDPVSGKQNYI